MELWDILDQNGNQTGRTVERGMPVQPGDYHLVVNVWIRNNKGEFLITKRTFNKTFPGMWETIGGSAVAGESSLQAALREVNEEIGLTLSAGNGKLLFRLKREKYQYPDFLDIWLFRNDIDISKLVLEPEEVCEAKWASKDDVISLFENGRFVNAFTFLEKLFKMV